MMNKLNTLLNNRLLDKTHIVKYQNKHIIKIVYEYHAVKIPSKHPP